MFFGVIITIIIICWVQIPS